MKKTLHYFLAITTIVLCVTSCSRNASKLTKYIPKDAAVVAGINAKNITEKLATGNMNLDTLAVLLSKNDGDSTGDMNKWDEIKSSGLDLSAEFYAFGKSSNSIMDGRSSTMGIVASLKDVAAFEKYLKTKKPTGEIKNGGDYSYLALGDDFIAGWKNDVAILVNVHGGKAAPGVYSTGEGTLSQQLLTKLFAQGESESVESIEAFKNVEKEQGDMFFYTNASAGQGSFSALSLIKVGDLVADAYTTGTVNFGNGNVTATFTGYSGKALGDILEKYPSHEIDITSVDRYPLQVNGFMAMSFDPKIIGEIVKFAGAEEIASQMLANYNLSLDDILKAFKGDITVAATITNETEPTIPGQPMAKPPVKYVVNAAIGEKAAYDKVITALNAKGVQLPKNGVLELPIMGHMAVSITDKNLVVASDLDVLQKYLNTGVQKGSLPSDIKEKITGKSFAMYVDVDEMLKAASQHGFNAEGAEAAQDTAKQIVRDFMATADKVKGRIAKGNAELRLFNEKQNSLVTIVNEAFTKKKQHRSFMGSQSMMMEPPPVVDSAVAKP